MQVVALSFSHDEKLLFSVGEDGQLFVWDTESGNYVTYDKCPIYSRATSLQVSVQPFQLSLFLPLIIPLQTRLFMRVFRVRHASYIPIHLTGFSSFAVSLAWTRLIIPFSRTTQSGGIWTDVKGLPTDNYQVALALNDRDSKIGLYCIKINPFKGQVERLPIKAVSARREYTSLAWSPDRNLIFAGTDSK